MGAGYTSGTNNFRVHPALFGYAEAARLISEGLKLTSDIYQANLELSVEVPLASIGARSRCEAAVTGAMAAESETQPKRTRGP